MKKGIICGIWTLALGLALCFYGLIVFDKSAQVLEYANGCDAFGYLSMAKKFRETSRFKWPEFSLEDDRTRKLVHLLRSEGLPQAKWSELVAPHAYHYFPVSGKVGPQYPPGTGWVLSLFEEGKA